MLHKKMLVIMEYGIEAFSWKNYPDRVTRTLIVRLPIFSDD